MSDEKKPQIENRKPPRKLKKAYTGSNSTWTSSATLVSTRPAVETVSNAHSPSPVAPVVENVNNTPPPSPAAPAPSGEPEYYSRTQLILLHLSTIPIMFLILLDASIISTAIPKITTEFPNSVLDIGWYGAAYQLSNACLQPLVGKLYKFFPSKFIFLGCFVVFEIGTVLCGLARSSKMLIAGRVIAGAGCSGILSGAIAMVSAGVPMAKRPSVMGLAMGVSQAGLVLGPIIGGILTEKTTWRWCFLCNLPAGVIFALPLAFLKVPGGHLPKGFLDNGVYPFVRDKMDFFGLALLSPSATMLLIALQYGGNDYPWASPVVIGLMCGSLCTFSVLILVEYREGRDAILPLWMVSRRIVWCSCLVMAFSVATTFCATYFLPIYFQAVVGATPIQSGLYLLPTIIAQLVAGGLGGILVERTGYYLPWSVFACILLTLGCGLMSTFSPATSPLAWAGYQIILGTGRGLGMSLPITALQNYLDESDSAIGTSFMFFGHTMGAAIFITLAQCVFTNGLRTLLPVYAHGVDPATIINSGITRKYPDAGDDAITKGIVKAICGSIDHVFYMTAAAAFMAFCFAWGIGWSDIRKNDPEKKRRINEGDLESGGCFLGLKGMIFREA